jgi:hypothetical protein
MPLSLLAALAFFGVSDPSGARSPLNAMSANDLYDVFALRAPAANFQATGDAGQPYRTAQAAGVVMSDSDLIDLAKLIARDEGFDLADGGPYEFEILDMHQPGYKAVGFDVNAHLVDGSCASREVLSHYRECLFAFVQWPLQSMTAWSRRWAHRYPASHAAHREAAAGPARHRASRCHQAHPSKLGHVDPVAPRRGLAKLTDRGTAIRRLSRLIRVAERSEGTLVADEHRAQIERRWPQRSRSETKPNADLTDGRAFEGLRWTRRGVRVLDCGAVGHVAVKSLSEPALVVRVNLRIVAAAGEGDIGQALVDERLAGAIEVDMHQDTVGGLRLGAVAGDGVAVVHVGMGAEIEIDGPA